jgi:hypothetical protein
VSVYYWQWRKCASPWCERDVFGVPDAAEFCCIGCYLAWMHGDPLRHDHHCEHDLKVGRDAAVRDGWVSGVQWAYYTPAPRTAELKETA